MLTISDVTYNTSENDLNKIDIEKFNIVVKDSEKDIKTLKDISFIFNKIGKFSIYNSDGLSNMKYFIIDNTYLDSDGDSVEEYELMFNSDESETSNKINYLYNFKTKNIYYDVIDYFNDNESYEIHHCIDLNNTYEIFKGNGKFPQTM